MEVSVMKTNYLKKYIISSYVLVWALIIFVAGTASLVFHAPTVVMWVVRNLIAWSPTYLLLMGWKYFRPDETRMGFVKRCFSAKVKLFPLICSSLINPRHPSSSPVRPEVKDRKMLSGNAVVPKLI